MAAITTYAALMYMGYIGYFLKDFKQNTSLNYYPLVWFGATLILTVTAFFLVEVAVVYKIGLTLLSGLILLSYLRKMNFKKDQLEKRI